MKKLCALVLLVLTAGCGPQINLADRPHFQNGVNTLTFMLYNALTGEAVTDATAAVTLRIGPHTLTGAHQGSNVWTVSGVPQGDHLAEITAPGFVSFLGNPEANCYGNVEDPQDYCYDQAYTVPMYREGSVTSDLLVKAFEYEGGAPISGGLVVASLDYTNFGTSFSNVLPGSSLRPTTVSATLVAGVATLPAASLLLGGNYRIDIFGAQNAAGQYLSPTTTYVEAGSEINTVTLYVSPPGGDLQALRVSNEDDKYDDVVSSLTVEFPYPVELCYEADDPYWTWTGGTNVDGDGVTPIPATPISVNTEIIATAVGSNLVLRPYYAPGMGVDPGDGETWISFWDVYVRIRGTTNCVSLYNMPIRDYYDYVNTEIRLQ